MPDAIPAIKAMRAILTGLKRCLNSVSETSETLTVSPRIRVSSSSYQRSRRWRLSQVEVTTNVSPLDVTSTPACPFLP